MGEGTRRATGGGIGELVVARRRALAQSRRFLHDRLVRVGPPAAQRKPHRPGRAAATALSVVIVLGLFWRVLRYALAMPLWGDEAFVAVSLLTRNLAGLMRPLEYWQIAPLGFMAAEWATCRLLGASEWALRLVPFFAGLASVAVFYPFAKRVLTRWESVLAIAMFSASYYPVRHACEVKPYALDLLVSLVLTATGWSVWQHPRSARAWCLLALLAAAGVWCSFPAVFTAAAVGLLLTARVARMRTIVPWAGWLAFGLLLVGSWAAMTALYAGPHARAAIGHIDTSAWENAYPPLSAPLRLPWWLLQVHSGYMLAYPLGGSGFCSMGTLLLVSIGSVVLWRRQRALLWLLLGPLAFNLLAAALHRYPYGTSARIALYMAPSFVLLAGVGLAVAIRRCVPRRFAILAVGAAITAMGFIPLTCGIIDLVKPYRSVEDVAHRSVARRLARVTRPGDRWLVYSGFLELPHYESIMLSPWLQQEAELRFYLLQQARVPVAWVTDYFQATRQAGPGRVWLVVHRTSMPAFPENAVAWLQQALTAERGVPKRKVVPFTPIEQLELDLFEAPPAGTARASAGVR